MIPETTRPVLFDLPPPGIEGVVEFSLYAPFYEREIGKQNGGLDLGKLHPHIPEAKKEAEIERYGRLVPLFSAHGRCSYQELTSMLKRYDWITTACSMQMKDSAELEAHVLLAYQVTYAHYVLAKLHKLRNGGFTSFPNRCCGMASSNMMAALLSLGYPNAAMCLNKDNDHVYILLPFVMEDSAMHGSIVIDPTSEQLWKSSKRPPRNAVFVKLGTEWEYEAEWQKSNPGPLTDLAPDKIMDLPTLRAFTEKTVYLYDDRFYLHQTGTRDFLEQAFANPVRVSPLS